MSFGFPAYHTDRYADRDTDRDSGGTDEPVHLGAAVRETLSALGWSIRAKERDPIAASTSLCAKSWGERVLIHFLRDNSISVTSKCAMPTQCVDWGKNRAYAREFIAEVRGHVGRPTAAAADHGPLQLVVRRVESSTSRGPFDPAP